MAFPRRSIAAVDAPKGPQNGLLQGAKPTRLRRLPTVRGRLGFDSLCEATPSVRQVKKQHLVGMICGQLRQLEAFGPVASTLFGTHRFRHLLNMPSIHTPKRFGAHKVPANHNVINSARSAGTWNSRLALK
jgi:hypothetical protein